MVNDTVRKVSNEFVPRHESLGCERGEREFNEEGVMTSERLCGKAGRDYQSNMPCNCGQPNCDRSPCTIYLCDEHADELRLLHPFETLTPLT